MTQKTVIDKNTLNLLNKMMLMFLVMIIFITDIFTCVAMKRTKRVPFATKLLTCLTLSCNAIFTSLMLIGSVVSVFTIDVSDVVTSFFSEFGRICITISWLSVTLMSMERVLCLYFPNFYARKASNKNIAVFTSVVICVFVFFKLFLRYLVVHMMESDEFDFVEATQNLQINTWILGTCLTISFACYIAIFVVVKRHVRSVSDIQPSWRTATSSYTSTKSITCIFAVFGFLHAPLFIALVIINVRRDSLLFVQLVLVFMIIMCTVNPMLYAWRFKECRLVMLTMIASRCGFCKSKIQEMRMDVYSIVSFSRHNNTETDV